MARTKVYVPRETAAVSVGADEVALAIAKKAKNSGTDRYRSSFTGHEYFRSGHYSVPRISSRRALNRASSTRPYVLPSIITAGEHAQLPRQ